MTDIFQTGRAEGKTTFAVERVKELVAEGHPVLVIVGSEHQARWWVRRLEHEGVDARPWKATKVQVVPLHSAEQRLRGTPRGLRIIAEDVDTWDEGIYHPVLCGRFAVELITSSFDAEPTLHMIRRVTRWQRELEARRQAEYRYRMRQFQEAYLRAWLAFHIEVPDA